MTQQRVYLDHAATTPVDPRVLEVMQAYFTQEFGNPSSIHRWGQKAEAAVERARQTIADHFKCSPREIVFTSCGSESDNLSLRGAVLAARQRNSGNHIITTPVEHDAVLRTVYQLAELHDFEVELLPVDSYGRVDPDHLSRIVRADTAIVSVIFGNNEIGTLNPIPALGQICADRDIPFHTDAVQAAVHMPTHVKELKVDLMSVSGHKLYGPKGVGALYIREGLDLIPSQTGGSQEHGFRAGTLNVPLIVGFAEAMRIAAEEQREVTRELISMRDHLIKEVLANIPNVRLTGHPSERLPNHASFVFQGIESNQMIAALDLAGYGCSSSSACKTGDPEPSKVLTALGFGRDWSLGSLRVTLGRRTSQDEVEGFLKTLPALLKQLHTEEAVST